MRPDAEARLTQLDGEDAELGRTAIGLALAIGRLRSRLREEAGIHRTGLSLSQISLLGRLINTGPSTAASLAAAEHVTQQAIAQIVAQLKADGLLAAERDPTDGRKSLLTVTPAARELYTALHDSRETWLIRAIEQTLSDDERAVLAEATGLLERLAAAELT